MTPLARDHIPSAIPSFGRDICDLKKRIAVILVNWNGWRDTIECLKSCFALECPVSRILVCDNASTDYSVEKIVSWARGEIAVPSDPATPIAISGARLPRGVAVLTRAAAECGDDGDGAELLVVQTGGNLGFAGGNNVALRWALAQSYDYCWLLNNDTVVPCDALSHLLDCAVADPAIGLCGSTMVKYACPTELQGYAGAIDTRNFRGRHLGAGWSVEAVDQAMHEDALLPHEVLYPIGASILVSTHFLRRVGLMEESYFLYYEEADWVLRGQPYFKVAIARKSLVYHKVGSSSGSTPQGISSSSVGFLYRSRLLIARRVAPRRLPYVVVSILSEAVRGLFRMRLGRVIGATRALSGKIRVPALPREH